MRRADHRLDYAEWAYSARSVDQAGSTSKPSYDEAHVLAELADDEPHRALVRDLIFEAEAGLHLGSKQVRKAIK
jgi:hypothetical protein